LALQYRAAIVVDAPNDESVRGLKESNSYPAGRKAMLNFGKLRRGLRELAEWHGAPCIEARLFSTACPNCGAKMLELQNRQVSCPMCGLEVHRDEVPAMWAQRRLDGLIGPANPRRGPSPRLVSGDSGPRSAAGDEGGRRFIEPAQA
jgi:putative transposase